MMMIRRTELQCESTHCTRSRTHWYTALNWLKSGRGMIVPDRVESLFIRGGDYMVFVGRRHSYCYSYSLPQKYYYMCVEGDTYIYCFCA